MSREGTLILISGPSGVGKTTLLDKIFSAKPQAFHRATTATTRIPRPHEKYSKNYYFWSINYFLNAISKNKLIEWNYLYDTDYYGTPRHEVEPYLARNKSVILTVNTDGVDFLRKKYQKCLSIFITAPSIACLQNRLRARNDTSQQQFEKRVRLACQEIELARFFDYVIINDNFIQTYHELLNILNYIEAR